MNRKISFFLAVAAQVVLLVVMFGFYQTIVNTGTEVWLKTRPIDPRDMFRGDYIQLDYDINHVSGVYNYDSNKYSTGDTVYASLDKQFGEKYFSVLSYNLSHDKCPDYPSTLCIKGRVVSISTQNQTNTSSPDQYNENSGPINLVLDYGINQYFVKEGSGQRITNSDKGEVKVVISKDSTAIVKEVWINDKKI
jgi:uncharacterized membrane-anchored protein